MGGTILPTTNDDNMQVIDNQQAVDFKKYAKQLQEADEKTQLEGVLALKKALKEVLHSENDLNNMVQLFLDMNVVSKFLEILKETKDLEIQYECTWTTINLCCSNTQKVAELVKAGIVDVLLSTVDTAVTTVNPKEKFVDVALQCAWTIGNIATDSIEHRDVCLEKDAVKRIVKLLEECSSSNDRLNKMGIWSVCRLVDMKPAPFWNQIADALPFFISVLKNSPSEKAVKYSLWGIYYISNSFLVNVFDSGCIPLITKNINQNDVSLAFPALKIVGNLVASSRDSFTDEVLKDESVLPRLFELCKYRDEDVKIYAGWALSNIAAGSSDQIAKLLQKPEYIQKLGEHLQEKDEKVKYQASCALANLVSRATSAQIEQLVEKHNYLDYLSSLMKETHIQIYERNVIEPINKVLKADNSKKLTPIFENKGLIEQMKTVSTNLNFEMRTMTENMIRQHFSNGSGAPLATNGIINIFPPSPITNIVPVQQPILTAKPVPRASESKKIKKIQRPPKQVRPPKLLKVQNKSTPRAGKTLRAVQKINRTAIRRTNTIEQVIEEAQTLIKGVKGRTRPTNKKAELTEKVKKANEKKLEKKNESKMVSNLLGSSRKIKRTNSMKQTLGEAKSILKQIDKHIQASLSKPSW